MECVICNDPVYGYGNNPAPVHEEGSCCDDCNMTVVLPARLKYHFETIESYYPKRKKKNV